MRRYLNQCANYIAKIVTPKKKTMTEIEKLQSKIGTKPDGQFGRLSARAFKVYYNLTSSEAAHFLGQCYHETGGFRRFEENLNYSYLGLMKTFKKYFDSVSAKEYSRKPEHIASRVYANRMGNGDEASGDGWKFRGRGAIQLTGKNNYRLFSSFKNDPEILANPDKVRTDYCFDAALWYFQRFDVWQKCGEVTTYSIGKVTRAINGGTNGIDDRTKHTQHFYEMLK